MQMRGSVVPIKLGMVGLMVTLALSLLAVPLPTDAQQAEKIYRIGFLAFGHRPVSHAVTAAPLAAFRQTLRELGYIESRNLLLEERWAEAHLHQLPVLAAELVRLKVDVIVASGASAVRAAKRVTQHIPIIIAGAADPVAEGLVASLAHPGANVTGVSVLPGRELEGKRLELLQEAVPGVTRAAVVLDSTSRLDPAPLQTAARALGITLLLSGETESPEEFRDTFTQMVRDGADAVYAPETPINVRQRRLIVELVLQHRLPAIYGSREFVEVGGLMAYGPNFAELFRRAATYVDRILKGASPSDLPVEQPMRFEFVVNLKTANALGLAIPPSLLIQADEVIQ
jgi:putative ABC transport system substrate-binding protein